MLRYRTGEEVQCGDVVLTGNRKVGFVKLIIPPGGVDGYDWECPDGGILIEEDWDGSPSLLAIPVDAGDWDDLVFKHRG